MVLPGKSEPEAWRAQGAGASLKQDFSKARSADWIALPMRSVVSVPMRFPSMAADRRDSAALLELEGAGISASESDFQVEVRDSGQREQRAWTVVQSGSPATFVNQAPLDARFAPSVCFRTLKRGEAQIWEENNHLAIAIPDENGKVIHAQALTAHVPDEDAAAEIRCVLAALDLAGLTPEIQDVVLQHGESETMATTLESFAAHLPHPVRTETARTPHPPQDSWRLVPPSVMQKRLDRRQQQTMMMAGAGFVLVLLALLGSYAGRLWSRESTLKKEIARIEQLEPELKLITEAQDKWTAIETAVTPEKFAMEIFHQVASLLPEEGIRLQGFEVRDGHIIINGEASNQGLANGLREDLQRVPAFAGLTWDFPNTLADASGRLPFRAEGIPASSEETPSL